MDKVIETMEQTIKTAQWDVDYHERNLQIAKEKLDNLLTGLEIIKAQQEESLPI